jgi:hypothetical protein
MTSVSPTPWVLTAAAVGAAVVWALWHASSSTSTKTSGKKASNKSERPRTKLQGRQITITPSLQRRQATMASMMPARPPKLERRRSSVINRDAASERIQEARRNPSHAEQGFEELEEDMEGIKPPRTWQDPCFPHSDESMFLGGVAPKDWLRDGERGRVLKDVKVSCEGPWAICGTKRPLGHNSRGEKSWLFHCLDGEDCGMDAHDVKQGSLGDCYFLSALALVATDTCCADGLVDDVFDAVGCFGVSFWVRGRWQMVWVDSFFPCYTPINKHSATPPKPIYAASTNRREVRPWRLLHQPSSLRAQAAVPRAPPPALPVSLVLCALSLTLTHANGGVAVLYDDAVACHADLAHGDGEGICQATRHLPGHWRRWTDRSRAAGAHGWQCVGGAHVERRR